MNNYTPVAHYPLIKSDGWKNLTGDLPVKMTNDYLFRALLQSDNEVLKAILASVLHMDVDEIKSAEITKEFLLGEEIGDKEFILDVNVVLNDKVITDLEMQVIKESFWSDRSLSYICRSFDNLNQGVEYANVKPVRQVAFCDFTLFEKYPEFHATYKILNVKKPEVEYSNKFIISNIDLTRIDLATEEDKKYGVDKWAQAYPAFLMRDAAPARGFKAETWEDMKMLAQKDDTIGRAISGVWQLTEEEMIRERCRAREEWIINDKWKSEQLVIKDAEIEQKNAEIEQKKAEIEQKKAEIEQKDAEIEQKNAEIDQEKAINEQLKAEIERLRAERNS